MYEPIYDNSYGLGFVFVDEEECEVDDVFIETPSAFFNCTEELH